MSKIKANLGTGAGGANTNLHGLAWEKKTYLKDLMEKLDYSLIEFENKTGSTPLFKVYKDEKLEAYYGQQGQIYKMFNSLFPEKCNSEHIERVLSKKINPDGFIYNPDKKVLHIFEKKWQQFSGSVDEKIQTAPFKREMFKKLLSNLEIDITYQYVLSEWYNQKQYRNIKEYYQELVAEPEKYGLWIEGLNLKALNLKDFIE